MNAHQKILLEQLGAEQETLLKYVPSYISNPEDKKEIVQEALRRLAEPGITQFHTLESFRAYAWSTVRNLSCDWIRNPHNRAKRVPVTDVHVDPVLRRTQDNPTPEEINLAKEQKRLFLQALNSLSRTTRQVLYMRLYEGYSQKEIAERLQLSPKSVGSIASVGLKQLALEFNKLSGNAERRRDQS